jgi:predicted ArsR family transcriptional regulator
MTSREDYENTLGELAALLRKQPRTVRQIAEAMGCCRPVAYKRLSDLRKRGEVYALPAQRTGRPGPRAALYGVVR